MSSPMRIRTIGYWGAYPGVDAATSSFLIEGEDTRILIDCGSVVLQNLQTYITPALLDAVIITHYHADHTADIGCLQYAIRVSHSLGERPSTPLPIYGHREDEKYVTLTYRTHTVFRPYCADTPVTLGPFVFRFFPVSHTEPSYAIRVSAGDFTAVFSGDSAYDERLVKAAENADVFFCESSLYNAFAGAVEGHLSAGEAGTIARKAGVKELVLTHLPHYGTHQDLVEEASEEYSGPVQLNKPGLIWKFSA